VVPSETNIELVGVPGVRASSSPLRVDADREIEWELTTRFSGLHEISFTVEDREVVTKRVAVGPERAIRALSAVRPSAGTWDAFLYPAEPPIPRDSAIESITIRYPARRLLIFGFAVNWLLAFFVISVAAGFALKGVFGIEV
jgi:hypothetical protein